MSCGAPQGTVPGPVVIAVASLRHHVGAFKEVRKDEKDLNRFESRKSLNWK